MNVLLTCAGRRGYLVDYFRQAVAGQGLVIAADATAEAPAVLDADVSVLVPRVDDPRYVPVVLDLCDELDVGLVVPLNDLELPVLAAARNRFAARGTTVVVSSVEVVRTCFDKWRTHRYLTRHGIPTPACWRTLAEALEALQDGLLGYPVTLKPRWGTASLNVEQAYDEAELRMAHSLVVSRLARGALADVSRHDWARSVLLQETAAGQEHGLDVVNDLNGSYAATFARQKLSMRAGETDRAVTVADTRLTQLGEQLGRMFRHVGVLDCDVFVAGDRITVLELNPRFGGGYPFSHAAGADVPAALLAWAGGRAAPTGWCSIAAGVVGAKCDIIVTAPPASARPRAESTWPAEHQALESAAGAR